MDGTKHDYPKTVYRACEARRNDRFPGGASTISGSKEKACEETTREDRDGQRRTAAGLKTYEGVLGQPAKAAVADLRAGAPPFTAAEVGRRQFISGEDRQEKLSRAVEPWSFRIFAVSHPLCASSLPVAPGDWPYTCAMVRRPRFFGSASLPKNFCFWAERFEWA